MAEDQLEEFTKKIDWESAVRVIAGLPAELEAHRHPLGFWHVSLGNTSEGTIRLHLWPRSSRYPQAPHWPIHTHTFDLQSIVLVGSIENRLYTTQTAHDGSHRVYEVNYSEADSVLRDTGRIVQASLSGCSAVTARQGYRVSVSEFHETAVPDNCFAATLVLAKQVSRSEAVPLVLGDLHGLSEYRYSRSSINENDLRKGLDELRSHLLA